MVCTGARSSEHAEMAVRKVVEKLRTSGIEIVSEPVVTIQNVVATADLGGKIHLLEAARQMPRSMYEPEQFAGLIHRMEDPKCVILLFASGRAVCTGARSEAEVCNAVNSLHQSLENRGLMIYS